MKARPSTSGFEGEREVEEKEESNADSSSFPGFWAPSFAKLGAFRGPLLKTCVVTVGLLSVALLGRAEEKSPHATGEVRGIPVAPAPAPAASSEAVSRPEQGRPAPEIAKAPCSASLSPTTSDGVKVDINTATENELRKLPGVGEKKAKAIIALRERMGRFKKANDLLRVKGIGAKMLKRMSDRIVISEVEKTNGVEKTKGGVPEKK